ncbi:MAG: Ig-like domain-containing protein [Myxococcota bacterium]
MRRVLTISLCLVPSACFTTPSVPDTDGAGSSGTSSSMVTGADIGSTGTSASPTTGDDPTSSGVDETGSTSGGLDETGDDTGDMTSTTSFADTEPPSVLVSDPAHGATSVIDQPVRITFDEPMDTASVEAAFPEAENFVWSRGDVEVEFDLAFPFTDESSLFDLVVPATVRDVAGNEMGEDFVATVGLAALQTITLEHDGGLTGHSSAGIAQSGGFFYVGDSTADTLRYGGVSFALSGLPAYDEVLGVVSATYRTQVVNTVGDPSQDELGGWYVDHAEFASVSGIATATVLEAEFDTILGDDPAPGDLIDLDVTGQLEQTWSGGDTTHFQLRMHPAGVAADGLGDVVTLRRGADENNGIIHESIVDPDEANRSRLVVEYFAG